MPGQIRMGDGTPIDSQPARAYMQYDPLRKYMQLQSDKLGDHASFLTWLMEEGMSGSVLLLTAIAIVEQGLAEKPEYYIRGVIRNIIARADTDPHVYERLEANGWA